jgi:glycosyltransferase involved in cell wall biosynthesis
VIKENCGLVFKAGDAEDLCRQIIKLSDRNEYDRLSRNISSRVTERYNWENYGRRLIELYSDLQK